MTVFVLQECIEGEGEVKLSNEVGISADSFLEQLSFYLEAALINFDWDPYQEKDGVTIGSCIAPILSDLFLARCDRRINDLLKYEKDLKIFRYVDDFVVFYKVGDDEADSKTAASISRSIKGPGVHSGEEE